MTDRRSEIRQALEELILEGSRLAANRREVAERGFWEAALKEFEKQNAASAADNRANKRPVSDDSTSPRSKKLGSEYLTAVNQFNASYQIWYSEALVVVRQLLPDRYPEFRDLYRPERRKAIDVETYAVADYLAGISITNAATGKHSFDAADVALGKFERQIAILRSAQRRLTSVLSDIQGVIEAGMFDAELDAAWELHKAKHLRSAGIIAGVVIERHLQSVIKKHEVTFTKTATMGNLNQALKDQGIYDVTQWRKLQYLADIRNLCGHHAIREPTAEEVEELIRGAAQVIKTVA